MIAQVHSYAAYLVAPNARICASGYHFLGNNDCAQFKAPILVLAQIIKNIMASVTEAEIGGLYMDAQEVISLFICLIDLSHQQQATPIITDNITTCGIIKGTMKQKNDESN